MLNKPTQRTDNSTGRMHARTSLRKARPKSSPQSQTPPTPSAIPTPSTHLRRSPRVPAPTSRARDYFRRHRETASSDHFPSEGDRIAVKWILGDSAVWWPARVICVNLASSTSTSRSGTLLYDKFRDYDAERSTVMFLWDSKSNERSVCSAQRHTNPSEIAGSSNRTCGESQCSWVFATQVPSLRAKSSITIHRSKPDQASSLVRYDSEILASSAIAPHADVVGNDQIMASSTIARRTRSKAVVPQQGVSSRTTATRNNPEPSPLSTQPSSRRQHIVTHRDRMTSPTPAPESRTEGRSSGDSKEVSDENPEAQTDIEMQMGSEGKPTAPNSFIGDSSTGNAAVQLRLELLERKMQDVQHSSRSTLSNSAQSVLTTLKWSLLRQLEKPLKELKLPDLLKLGVGSHQYQASSQCDYMTFRELASNLAHMHRCLSPDEQSGRVAFSPSFHIIQSGSVASNNLTIIFSVLSDLTDFLRIRDELDFEKMLCKEVITDDKSFLRLLGTFTLRKDPSSGETSSRNTTQTQVNSTNSISVESTTPVHRIDNRTSSIQIFLASAPCSTDLRTLPSDYNTISGLQSGTSRVVRTQVIKQDCAHFDATIGAFQTEWSTFDCFSNFKVNCKFDLDGIARPSDLENFFTLSWSRLPAPSQKKWTRDIQTTGINSPGTLTMTVPSIFLTSRKNVTDISTILDNNIECFMDFRSAFQNLSPMV